MDSGGLRCVEMAPPGVRVVGLAVSQDGPDGAQMFVGDSDEGLVIAGSAIEIDYPLLESRAS